MSAHDPASALDLAVIAEAFACPLARFDRLVLGACHWGAVVVTLVVLGLVVEGVIK